MRNNNIEDYKNRIDLMMPNVDVSAKTLLQDLIDELQRIAEENKRLRGSLLKITTKSKMSSKLKDALME